MRGRVAAVSLFLSLLSLDLSGQCAFAPRYSGQFRATIYDVAIDGSYIWTATGYGVQLLGSTADGPEILDAVALPGSTRAVEPHVNGLTYAGSGSRLFALRRNGTNIEIAGSVDAPGAINEIAATATHLFVATKNGLAHYDLLDPAHPSPTNATLVTSRANVTSLAVTRDTLYATDTDATVEIFNISVPSIPQRIGSIESMPRSSGVHVGADGFVYVSDEIGQNTEIFSGTNRIARVPYGSTSYASSASGVLFVAGGDRTLRALDLIDPARPAELFEQQLAPTGGTNNAIFEIVRSGNTLYVAAGDIGLLTFDIASLSRPYPMISYGGGATTSALIIEGSAPKAYFGNGATIAETDLQLATPRTMTREGVIHDSRGSDLLVASGSAVSLTSFTSTTFEATFRAAVSDAAMAGDTIVALLADQSVWTVKPTAGATPGQVDLGGAKISYLARSGSSYALAEVKDDGTTVIHIGSKKFTADGAAIGGLALNSTHAAFFTYRGINLLDIATGVVTVLPDSTRLLPRELHFAGTHLLVLGDRTLNGWSTSQHTLIRSHPLPANAVRMHTGAQRAAIATSEGTLILDYLAALPSLVDDPDVNRYYSKAVTGGERLYLFSPDGVDVYSTLGTAPSFVTAIREPGLIDVAATQGNFFTLAGDGTVKAYSLAGAVIAETLLNPADSQPLAIFTAGDAVWVSLSSGCGSSVCGKQTYLLDPRTLSTTTILQGGVIDVAVSGSEAFAILDLPSELVAFNIADPLHPAVKARIAAPATLTSIAAANGNVYVVGQKSYTYSTALVLKSEDATSTLSATPLVEASGPCVLLTGRAENPEPLWASPPAFELPSTARSLASQPGRFYVLTEHSIEVWSTTAPGPAPRRRSVR